jgi:SAM-dependent methyltransferase
MQGRTDAYFGGAAAYWRDVYANEGLQGVVYRERMQTVLTWIDALRLPAGTRVLEVGCGAGHATLELARRGFAVESTDSSGDMVALASRRIAEAGLSESVAVGVADVHALPQASGTFALVLALGVLPWLHSPEPAVGELARVLAPGGRAIVTVDNRLRLNMITEPRESPLLAPLKLAWRAVKRLLGRRESGAVSRLHTPRRADRMLRAAGLEPERWTTIGFGPFTFLGRTVLRGGAGLGLHRRLQGLADRGARGLRRAGWHYVVSARRA